MKILIVEDDENSRILLETALLSSGYNVMCAENGRVALDLALKNPPDIIVSDILMPEMDGYELCKQVKRDRNLCNIPFVFYTATYTDPKDERLAMDLGASGFIVKPMEIHLLLQEIESVLRGSDISDPKISENEMKDPEELHREYSEVVTRKLDKKVRQLEIERNKLKESENIIKRNLQKLNGILENISMGVVMIDKEMKIVEMNRQMREWFPDVDCTHNPLCYKEINYSGNEEICDFCPALKAFEDGDVHEETIRIKRNERIRFYRIICSPIKEDNRITGVIEIVEDITQKLETEKKLDQAQKLEAIGTLAGGIAHDFNNILTSIIGYTELALEDVEEDSSVERDLNEIYSAGKRAKDLVHQILLFARKSDHDRKPVRIGMVVNEVLRFIRSSIPTTIDIIQEINSDALVLGDSTQVHQIMMNICTNAAQSMEDEGILRVVLNDVTIDENLLEAFGVKKPGEYVELKISDTGTGIPKEIINKIFNPYFTTKEPGEGTGLGLSLVHGIVDSYGGSISVTSEKCKGSTFVIYLPAIEKAEDSFMHIDEDLPRGDERILFVDDEKSIGEISEEILSRLGYSVTACTDSIEALEIYRKDPDGYDLVITDMTMPNMSGDRLAKEILAIKHDAAVILFTGYNRKITMEKIDEIGIRALAYKPVIKADLARIVRSVLDNLQI